VSAVFNTGGANRPEIWREIRDVLGPAEILTAYGMTETTASTTCTLPEGEDNHLSSSNGCLKDAGPAAAGAAGPHLARYKAIDPVSGADLPAGSTGELVVRGPGVTVGYFDKPEETASAFTPDGWLRTGDLGRIGADGFLALTGRIKETFRCGGETVMPREIEALLETADGVAQAIVVGVPDPRMGEVGCACIVACGPRPSTAALTTLCEARLARFKVPRHFLFFAADEIPLTPTGRPRKYQLAELARARLGG
jgi:fatty-acyl-CoA synthase